MKCSQLELTARFISSILAVLSSITAALHVEAASNETLEEPKRSIADSRAARQQNVAEHNQPGKLKRSVCINTERRARVVDVLVRISFV